MLSSSVTRELLQNQTHSGLCLRKGSKKYKELIAIDKTKKHTGDGEEEAERQH